MDIEAWRKKLEERCEETRIAFEGQYRSAIEGLLGLSQEQIRAVSPEITSAETYAKLITIVKAASAANISQAELKNRIIALGEVGIKIARQVAPLAALLL